MRYTLPGMSYYWGSLTSCPFALTLLLRPPAGLADLSKICPESDLNPVCETGVVPTYLLSHIGVGFKAKSVLTAGDVSKSGPYLQLRVLRNNSRSK